MRTNRVQIRGGPSERGRVGRTAMIRVLANGETRQPVIPDDATRDGKGSRTRRYTLDTHRFPCGGCTSCTYPPYDRIALCELWRNSASQRQRFPLEAPLRTRHAAISYLHDQKRREDGLTCTSHNSYCRFAQSYRAGPKAPVWARIYERRENSEGLVAGRTKPERSTTTAPWQRLSFTLNSRSGWSPSSECGERVTSEPGRTRFKRAGRKQVNFLPFSRAWIGWI